MMTEQEKKEIIDELEKRLADKYLVSRTSEETLYNRLVEPRRKWIRGTGSAKTGKMEEVFEGCDIWAIWERIRYITCKICGKSYVRQLEENDHADDVAEILCQTIYDLAIKHKNEHGLTLTEGAEK